MGPTGSFAGRPGRGRRSETTGPIPVEKRKRRLTEKQQAHLLPQPRQIRRAPGRVRLILSARRLAPVAEVDPAAAGVLRTAYLDSVEREGRSAGERLPVPRLAAEIREVNFSDSNEAYRLTVGAEGVLLEGASARGVYYAAQTLRGLIAQYGTAVPCLTIEDYPQFPLRGFLHDVSRGKVPRRSTLFGLVERLASLKYNQLQLYVEHTFKFQSHPKIGRGHSRLTPGDIHALGRHCRRHHIELVPCLQSFGHATHILKLREYAHLAESNFRGGWTLSPAERGTYRLLKDLYADFLPCFPDGEYFNACCDETWDLGRGKTRSKVVLGGLGDVYVGHLKKVRRMARRYGRRAMFWADILEKHPHHVVTLPKDAGLLHWEYEAGKSTSAVTRRVRKLAVPRGKAKLGRRDREVWVCPGTSAWNSLFFRQANAEANIHQLARSGALIGAKGFLLTDWGDNGHYNFLSNSLWPIAWGAECSWNAPARGPDPQPFEKAFLHGVLGAPEASWVKAARLLGGLSEDFGVKVENHSPERWLLTGAPEPEADLLGVGRMIEPYLKIGVNGLRRGLRHAEQAAAMLVPLRPVPEELKRVRDEWLLSARLAAFACRRALLLRGSPTTGDTAASLSEESGVLAQRFEELWLARNRESDLERIREDFRRIEHELGDAE